MKISLTIFIAIATLSMGVAQNLLKNGNFDNITSPDGQAVGALPTASSSWTTSITIASRPAIVLNAALAKSGDNFLNLPNDFMSFRQSFKAVANTKYTLKLSNRFVSTTGLPASTDGIFISIRKDNGANGTVFVPPITLAINPQLGNLEWTEFSVDFDAPETDLLLFVTKQTRAINTNPNNGCRMDDFSITKAINSSTRNLEEFGFSSFPNPVNDVLYLSASKNITQIEIYNLLGEVVIQKMIGNTNEQINTSSLTKGIYIVKASIGEVVGTYKFVKQ
jgi:hypothetical protein